MARGAALEREEAIDVWGTDEAALRTVDENMAHLPV